LDLVWLVVVALLCGGGLAPAAAQAAPSFKAGFYPATVDASGGSEKFTLEPGNVECKTTSYHGEILKASTTLALTPAYSECTSWTGISATITTNGCSYLLHVTEQTAEDEHKASFDLVCEEGKDMTIDAGLCVAHIPPQSGLASVRLISDREATPKRDITFKPEISSLSYTATDGFACDFNGSGAKTGSFTSSSPITLTGQSPSNPETKIGIEVGEPPVGPPSFRAGFYPATPHGSGGQEKFALEAGSVECTTTSYDGELKETSTTLALTPAYSSCKAFGFGEAVVATTGCSYVLHVSEQTAEDEYKSTFDIACAAGKAIKIAAATCEAEIPAQTGLKAVALANDTEATPKRDITFKPEISTLAYTVVADGFGCPFAGKGAKTGSFTSSSPITLTGQSPSNPETKIAVEVG